MRKILLVDDDKDILEILKDFLEEHQIEVFTNNTGYGVIEQILRQEPNVVILDVNLLDNSGFDILRDIRSNPLTSFLPVIMLTGQKDENAQIEGLSSGADDYVLKPFDLNVLYARILSVFRRSLISTRTRYDQLNLLNHMILVYQKRQYQVFTKLNEKFDSHPSGWKGFVPDLIIMKRNKLRVFLLETAQTILEENFLKRLEELTYLRYKDIKIESNIIVRSKETYRQCYEIIKEYGYDIKIKLITKSVKSGRIMLE